MPKLFHQKCLVLWDKNKRMMNQKLSCLCCKKELPLNLWERKLNFEDERINEAQLIDKINKNELNLQVKKNEYEILKNERNNIYNKYSVVLGKIRNFLCNFNH